MNIFQDEYSSMHEEIILPVHDHEDCRGAGHHEEDQWVEGGNHLLSSVLFTVKEILGLFV